MTATELDIRDAREDERAAIRALTLAAYAEYAQVMAPRAWAGLDQAVRAALDTTEPVDRIVATRDGQLVGSVMLYAPDADAYGHDQAGPGWPELRLLAVDATARGQQVGSALVRECMRRAKATGASALGLHTSDSLHVAVRMYERMGFARVPAYDFQTPGAELVKAYRLDLASGQW